MKLFNTNLNHYFNYFKKYLGKKIYVYILMNSILGIVDGIGLAMFIPLLFSLTSSGQQIKINTPQLGSLNQLINAMAKLNIKLNPIHILLIIIIIFIIKGILKYIQVRLLANIRFEFIRKTRLNLINGLEQLSYTEFIKKDSGKIQNNITTEITKLFTTITNYFTSIQALSMLIIYISILILADWKLAFILLIGGTIINKLYKKLTNKIKYASGSIADNSHIFNGKLLQTIYHFKYLKVTQRFKLYAKNLKEIINETDRLNLKIGKYQAISEGIKDPIAVIIISILFLLQLYILKGSTSIILLSILLLYRCITQYTLFQTTNQAFANGIGSITSIQKLQNELNSSKETYQGKNEFHQIDKIELKAVNLFIGNSQILKNINIVIKGNSTIAIVGESGAGKTTLANIITSLIEPSSGNIILNSQPLASYNINHYREKIGYIIQEPVIFNDSLFNNVSFFDSLSDKNQKKFNQAIRQSNLEKVVDSLPNGLNTNLGDNGSILSGGQKQRVSIARELYQNKKIIIFDEATSSLDKNTENTIQKEIEKLKGLCTIIIISHNLAAVKSADYIYIIKEKTIIDEGCYAELLSKSENFKTLF